MSLKTTSILNQSAFSGNRVTSSFDPDKTAGKNLSSSTGSFLQPRAKQAPQDLAEHINEAGAKSGATIMILDADQNDEVVYMTNKFFLSNFSMSFQEKVQLLETFDASSVSFFGNTARVYAFQGQAIDYPSTTTSHGTMHQSSLIHLYQSQLRGTELLKNNYIAVMKIMNHLVYGYPMNMKVNYNASADKIASFSLSWLVTQHELTVPGWVNERQLQQLYDPEGSRVSDDKLDFLDNITTVTEPLKRLLYMKSTDYPSMESLRNQQGTYSIGGLKVENAHITLQPTSLQRYSYEFIKNDDTSSWGEFGDKLLEAAKAAKAAIASQRQSTLGYKSPKLADWSDTKLDKFANAASRAIVSWEEFQKFQAYLIDLEELLRQLQQFKQRIISS